MNILNVKDLPGGSPPVGSVYVGRPEKWGNPFVIGRDGDRQRVIDKFKEWVWREGQKDLRNAARRELKGKDLVCWCSPEPCHAEIWKEIAESPEEV